MNTTVNDNIAIYIATHNQSIISPEKHRIPIQSGAALSCEDLCELHDNTGDNISLKNREFCELTALYWIWKNDSHSICGLEHYRRRFMLETDKIPSILSQYDIIIPPPYYFRFSLKKEYQLFHCEDDLDALLKILHQTSPQMMHSINNVLSQNRLIPYNMMIAQKELLCEYCQWLFPVLFQLENMIAFEGRDLYQRRAFGFLSERLLTAYIYERKWNAYTVPVSVPENSTTLLKKLKFKCSPLFNSLYFKLMEPHE